MLSTGLARQTNKKRPRDGERDRVCSRRSLRNFKLIKGNDHTKQRYFLDILTPCPFYIKAFFSFYFLLALPCLVG